jgi:NADH-quinone oxidoreductase subunit E
METVDIINKFENRKDNLLQILIEVQNNNEFNYIPSEDIKIMSEQLNISESKILSIISFYSLLSTKPRGKYIIQVCSNIVCYINDSINIVTELEKELNIKMGETTKDSLFTLEYTSCIGHCNKAPAIRINNKIYNNLNSDMIKDIISKYRSS